MTRIPLSRVPMLLVWAVLAASSAGAAAVSEASLRLSGTEFYRDAEIELGFSVPEGLPNNAWVGIVPAEVAHGREAINDQHDLTYQYLGGKTSGTLTFRAPSRSGRYDFRLHDTDSDGKELAYVTFEVVPPDYGPAELRLQQEQYAVGSQILVGFTAPEGLQENAWVGIVPSEVPHGDEGTNDQHDISFHYLRGETSGLLSFRAPSQGGSYDLRMHDTDSSGIEIASVSFVVAGDLDAAAMGRELESGGRVVLYGIRFATDKATLTPESRSTLAEVGKLLTAQRELRLLIEGHTDDRGDEDYNLDLSQRRSEAVKTYLVDVLAISAARLATHGLGESVPIASNDTEAGRAQNRRVELVRQ